MFYMWLILSIILILVEIFTVGIITVFMALSALIIAGLSLIGFDIYQQIIFFVLLSLLLIIAARPLLLQYVNKKIVKTNANTLIGKEFIVYESIDNFKNQGKIKINDLVWMAKSDDERLIEKGSLVQVIAIDGVKLIVKKI